MNRRSIPLRHIEPQRDTPHSQDYLKMRVHSHLFKMMGISAFIVLAFLYCGFPIYSYAQVGNCKQSTGEAFLDTGNVRARIPNNGGLFWRDTPHVYEVPKNEGTHAIFTSSIWIGGQIDNKLHFAGSTYGPWEFWPGPLDASGNPPTDCSIYDTIWEIKNSDIASYLQTDSISSNLANWPWQLGAPVIDGDGNPTNYNLEGGDLPELLGDQRLWWIMNDRGNTHERSASEPIGLEVHASAFGYASEGTLGDQSFYSYRLINKNSAPLEDAYFGFFTDVDLGNFDDDYVGSDSLLHLGYAYNADNDDEGTGGYGAAPPAIGITILETINKSADGFDNDRDGDVDESDEKLGTTSVVFFIGGGGLRDEPESAAEFYNYMMARWKDNTPIYEGLAGYRFSDWPAELPLNRTRFMFSGDPVTQSFWSALNTDGSGTTRTSHDQRFLTASGPFELAPHDTTDIYVAILWARGNSNLDSVTQLKQVAASIRNATGSIFTPTIVSTQPPAPYPPSRYTLGFNQNFPNPFTQSTTLRYSLPQSMRVKLTVYDVLGREVALLADAQQDAGIYAVDFDAGDLPAGLYLARIELDHLRFTKRMVKTN